jgi:hypothetical protein
MSRLLVVALGLTSLIASSASPDAGTSRALVFCAPGYPGTTQEAQSRMDDLAGALGELASWPADSLTATYFPQQKPGLARIAQPDVAIALVPLPFFLAHEVELKLRPKLAVVQQGLEATQSWTLVAKKGTVKKPADLEGYSIFSTAGYAPAFVTHVALEGFGPLPASVKVTTGPQVLSALRKASAQEKSVVLLDAEQAKALPTLPFANELEVIHVGPKVPVAVVATVAERLTAAEWKAVAAAFQKLPSVPRGKTAMEGVRLTGFVPLDEATLAKAKKAYGSSVK